MKSFTVVIIGLFIFLLNSCNKSVDDNNSHSNPQNQNLEIANSKSGIGLIHFNTELPIPFYINENGSLAYDTLKFKIKKTGVNQGITLFKTKFLKYKLQPYTLSGGTSTQEGLGNINTGLIPFSPEVVFRVIKKTASGVLVIINEDTLQTLFIRINTNNNLRLDEEYKSENFDPNFINTKIKNWYYYETWKQALVRAYFINLNRNAKLFDEPEGNIIRGNRHQPLTIDSVSGDWARLTNHHFEMNDKKIIGWMKWLENDSITINIMLNGGYD